MAWKRTLRAKRSKPILMSAEFIQRHTAKGCTVDTDAPGLPVCVTCSCLYINGRVLAFEPDGADDASADVVEVRR